MKIEDTTEKRLYLPLYPTMFIFDTQAEQFISKTIKYTNDAIYAFVYASASSE